ncbi:unnamed protein product [Moneuplotes crassus]|uniref:NAC-A/B domain-containing protein n=1 Tax=Euplotes crassus TaxID=5936 RepID=A0AAD2D407_EUPCR|nr:unnamed protein product [Moneuplotes crassus]
MASQDTDPKVVEVTDETEKQEEEMPALESQPKKDRKLNKAEKKCIKALNKMGMKTQSGITRVTLKRRDGIVFVISAPEVYRSPTSDNSFVVVGELKMDEPRIDNLPTPPAPTATAEKTEETSAKKTEDKPADTKEEDKEEGKKAETQEDDDEELDESGLTQMHIDMVMQNANCSRREAVKALIASNNDMVNAIMHLTK